MNPPIVADNAALGSRLSCCMDSKFRDMSNYPCIVSPVYTFLKRRPHGTYNQYSCHAIAGLMINKQQGQPGAATAVSHSLPYGLATLRVSGACMEYVLACYVCTIRFLWTPRVEILVRPLGYYVSHYSTDRITSIRLDG